MTVTRWARYGHDRLYVRLGDGRDVGWWDLHTDEPHPAEQGLTDHLVRAVAEWQVAHPWVASQSPPNSVVQQAPPPPQPPAEPVWDLAFTPPGAQLYGQVAAAQAAGQRGTFWRRLFLGKHAYSTWERGLIGEQLVEAELRRLAMADRRWGYLNSIAVGQNGADIDHLVVGPAGVFTINAKYHRGSRVWVAGDTVMVNGQRQPYVRNARYEARRAAALLTKSCGFAVPVRGLVVPVDAAGFTVREQPIDVHVVNRARLVDFLWNQPALLEQAVVGRVLDRARLSTTWTTPKH